MRTLIRFAFRKSFLIPLGILCALLVFLRFLCPVFGLERAELQPAGYSVDDAKNVYMGRSKSLYVFTEGEHIATLELPKELRGYHSFAVLSDRILFQKKYGVMWQSSLDLTDVQKCSDQKEAERQMKHEKETELNGYSFSGNFFFERVISKKSREVVAKTPMHDNLYCVVFFSVWLLIFVQGIRFALFARKIDRNNHWGRHPNWDD